MMFISIVLFSLMFINQSQADYPDQKCLICSAASDCNTAKAELCPKDLSNAKSGVSFVEKALGPTNNLSTISTALDNYVSSLGIPPNVTTWNKLTRYVCYTAEDGARGCLVMGKGLCTSDRTWLGKITGLADKITGIMGQAAKSVTSMFAGTSSATPLSDQNKTLISQWIATNYFAPLVNNSIGPDGTLKNCCEGDGCNFSTIVKQSILTVCLSLIGLFVAII